MDRRLRIKWLVPYRRLREDNLVSDGIVAYGERRIQMSKDLEIYEVERILVINLWFVVLSFSWSKLDG